MGHLLSTLNVLTLALQTTPLPAVLSAQEVKLATWMTSRSPRNMTSSSSFLVANPQSAAYVGLASMFLISAL
jgi:hypothetical protein